MRRRYTRTMKNPRMPSTSSTPEKRPTQSSRCGSRFRASPKSLPPVSNARQPQARANCVEKQEPRQAHPVLARHRSRQRRQARHKLREHQHYAAPPPKRVLRATNTNRRLHRKLAENAQHMVPIAPPDQKPARVSRHASQESSQKRRAKADLVIRREPARRQQYRRRRQWNSELLHQHPAEEQDVAVSKKNVCGKRHTPIPVFCRVQITIRVQGATR